MAERWKIFLIIAFVALTVMPISMMAAKIDVPVWAMIAGHCGQSSLGLLLEN
ncbi:hypothetical protein [Citrobacter farmeri]|uniref:hypothetical protein n=1 Tax=Citrobacter farmeri TaxID=67824 RepID=UPI00388DA03B|nr:hypothetical protein [Citrobacter farmeri]